MLLGQVHLILVSEVNKRSLGGSKETRQALVLLIDTAAMSVSRQRGPAMSNQHQAEEQADAFSERYQASVRNPQEDFDFIELALANELSIGRVMKFRPRRISARTYLGSGQVQEIARALQLLDDTVVVTNAPLSPVHQRNLEEVWQTRILTRAHIIFEIFERNATTAEGKLQVELARLRYELPRIVGLGKELSSPGGDLGTRGGRGEKLTAETKDIIRRRIRRLESRLARAHGVRALRRKRRRKAQLFTVSLVGYTNSGKTSLLNALTHSRAEVAERYFTTLDPLARGFTFEGGQRIIVNDTVGFLHDLPPELTAAFRATIEELTDTSLFLIVVDASRENVDFRLPRVFAILEDYGLGEIPDVVILNKIDLIDNPQYLKRLQARYPESLALSVRTGEGLEELRKLLVQRAYAWSRTRISVGTS